MINEEKSTYFLLFRLGLYGFCIFLLHLLLAFYLLPKGWSFSENAHIEWLQFSLVSTAAIILLVGAIVFPVQRRTLFLLFTCAFIACARELDKSLDELIPVIGWQAIFFIAVLIALWQLKNFKETKAQLMKFFVSPAMAVCWTAIVIIIALAQCIGDKSYLQAALGSEYTRNSKKIIEESLELYGYLILLCGSIETLFFARNQNLGNRE